MPDDAIAPLDKLSLSGHSISSGRLPVSVKSKFGVALLTFTFVVSVLTVPSAFAITAEVAKSCGALAAKAYPLRMPGNPAGGRVNGTGADYQKYFSQCVANGGKMSEQTPTQSNTQVPPASNQSGSPANQVPK
jgi:hypothetical protein